MSLFNWGKKEKEERCILTRDRILKDAKNRRKKLKNMNYSSLNLKFDYSFNGLYYDMYSLEIKLKDELIIERGTKEELQLIIDNLGYCYYYYKPKPQPPYKKKFNRQETNIKRKLKYV